MWRLHTGDLVVVDESAMTDTPALAAIQKELRKALDVADEQPEGSIYLIPVRLELCEFPDRLSACTGSTSSATTATNAS